MRIFNNACVQDPIAFEPTIWPSSIRSKATGEVLLFSRPVSMSRYVTPTIRFGSLVFKHQENIDSQLYKAQGPDSVLVGSIPINLSSGQMSTEQDSGSDPDFDNSKDESTLCKTIVSVRHLSIGRLSTPSDQRSAHPKVPMKNQKTCTSLR